MRLRVIIALLAWAVLQTSATAQPTSDWHPARVADFVVPLDTAAPPWVLPGGRPDPFGIVAGPDGTMWFTELNWSRIGEIRPDGHVVQFRVSGGNQFLHPNPTAIVSSPHGTLWFTTQTGFGAIAKDGRISMYAAAGLNEGMLPKLAPDDDGVWVLSNRLGHVGKDRRLHWFALPRSPGADVEAVFTGTNHRVWALVAYFGSSSGAGHRWTFGVSPISNDGVLGSPIVFSLPSTDSGLLPTISSIVAAPDGTFWLSEGAGQSAPPYTARIDQVFPSGRVVQRATLPSAYHVVVGPYHTILVQGNDAIMKFAADGSQSTYHPHTESPISGSMIIGGIAPGPHGTIWFTYSDGSGRVGEITP